MVDCNFPTWAIHSLCWPAGVPPSAGAPFHDTWPLPAGTTATCHLLYLSGRGCLDGDAGVLTSMSAGVCVDDLPCCVVMVVVVLKLYVIRCCGECVLYPV